MCKSLILFLTILVTINKSVAGNITQVAIQDLENQKDVLYKQINKAIDDTMINLKEHNNSGSLLVHMKELKKQIKVLNETEDGDNDPNELFKGSQVESNTKKTNSQSNVRRHAAMESPKNKDIKLNLADIVDLLRKKEKTGKSKTGNAKFEQHKKIIHEKIDLWIKQQEEAKAKKIEIQNKQKQYRKKFEKCPKEGTQSDTKKRSKSYLEESDNKKKRSVYPCCRKCCKRSAMGCL